MDFPFYGGSAASPATWANRPATPFVGQRIRCTDLGNKEFYWNGTVWLPMGSSILAQSGAPASVTGTTAETTLASITIPGGMMGSNGAIRVTALASCTNNANIKNLRINYGGTQVFDNNMGNFATFNALCVIRNRNALASQIANIWSAGGNTAANKSAAVNSAVDQTLTITSALAVGTDTATLEGYTVEVLPT